MKHASLWRPLAVVSALVLGAGLVWYQSSLIAEAPPAHTAPEPPPTSGIRPDPVPNPFASFEQEDRPPALEPPPAVVYFNPSKSASGMMPVLPPPAAGEGEEAQSRTPTFFPTSKSLVLHPLIPLESSAPVDETGHGLLDDEAADE